MKTAIGNNMVHAWPKFTPNLCVQLVWVISRLLFISRFSQSSGIPVAPWEIDELLETLTGNATDAGINYQ